MEWREQRRSNPHKSVLLTHLPLRRAGVPLLPLPRRAGGVDVGQVPVVFLSPPHPCSPPLGHRRPARVMDKRRRGVHTFITVPSRLAQQGRSWRRSAADFCRCVSLQELREECVENRVCNFYISNKIAGPNPSKVRRNVLIRKGSASSLRLDSAVDSSPQIPATCREIISTQGIKDSSSAF